MLSGAACVSRGDQEREGIIRKMARLAHRASVTEVLYDVEHAFESGAREFSLARGHLDLVDDLALDQVFQRPRQMLRIDARHGRAHAYGGRHEPHNFALRLELLGDAVDEIEFGADQ